MAGKHEGALRRLARAAAWAAFAALALVGAPSARADNTFVVAPSIFTSPPGGGGSCTGCHGSPPELDQVHHGATGDGRGASPTSPILASSTVWQPSVLAHFTSPQASDTCRQADVGDRFICWFASVQANDSSAMGPFYNYVKNATGQSGAPHTAAAQMGQYLVDVMNASVTPSSHALSFANTDTGASSFPTASFTIANRRFGDLPYSLSSLNADYGLVSDSCAATHQVPGMNTVVHGPASATNTCTITIEFHPQAAGDRSSQLTLSFGTPSPDQYVPPAVTIALAGTGFGRPTAAIAALSTPVATGATIALDGSGSTDPNPGGTLSYAWHVTRDGASFTDLTGATPSFQATGHGSYAVSLIVSDAYASSTAASRTVLAVDRPVAHITVSPAAAPYYIANTISFDSSASTKQAGDTLTAAWSISPAPGGSAWQVDAVHGTATLTPPDNRSYTVSLDVDDQGVHAAAPASVTIAAVAPPPPHADAGVSRPALVNTLVALDGTHSTSGNGHALACAWTVTRHADSAVQTVANANSCSASFTPTVTGDYDVRLTVFDGYSSAVATITITSSNGEVVVDAGADQSVILGATAVLSGSGTSGIGDTLTYAWTLTTVPAGSTATIANASSATAATLTPDRPGTWLARLTATDQHGHTGFASATLTVQPPLTASAQSLVVAASLGSSTTASLVLTDNDSTPLVLQSATFGGAAPGDYALDASNGCPAAAAIAHAAPCTLVIRFTPSAIGARNATLALGYAGAGSPLVVTLLGTATPTPQGQLASSTWSQAFGDTVVGASDVKTIVLSNSSAGASAAPVVLSGLSLSGNAAADYHLGGTCSLATPLAPQATCTVQVTFAPSAAGTRAASLLVASDASNPQVSIGLAGKGLAAPVPVLGVSPASLNFGQQTVGGAYPPQLATLTNTGSAALAVAAVTIAGPGFSIADASACYGVTLAVGASCQVSVAFAPSSPQASATGVLTIASNAVNAPTTLALLGAGTSAAAPVLAWAGGATALDFGTVQAGEVSAVRHAVLTNQGPGGATLAFVNAVGTGSAAFAIGLGTCPATQPLFAGASCQLDITFAPSAAGARTAALQVVSNGSAPAPLVVTGVGLGSPDLALAVSSSTMDLGSVQLGSRSAPSALRLSNTGAGNVQVAAISATGAFSVQGSSCPPTPFTLQSGAECTVAVVFQPTATGAASGTLTVQSDAQSAAGDVALAGHADSAPALSSGGCSISRGDGLADPTLWTLAVLALAALAWRARTRRRPAADARERAPGGR